MIEPEEGLVLRSRQGDSVAFEELVRRTARLLLAHLILQTGDLHGAEDLVQETYLLAWRSIAEVDDPKRFRPWLFSIARRATIDAARRRGRLKRTASAPPATAESPLDAVPDPAADPSQGAQQREERQQALDALNALPEEYRQVLMLRYLAGADYQTISRQLALTNGSLRGLLHRGMALLREKLNDAG